MAEALAVSEELPAPLATVCRVAGVSRSAACEQRRRRGASEPVRRRPGPVGAMSDGKLLAEIRQVLANSPFVGEGHRKVWARLRRRSVRTSRKRVLRLTREAGLLAPTGRVRKRAARLHEGTITVEMPDTLWATDATEAWSREGRAAVFCVVDHGSGEAWSDAALRMDRFAAADLLREVCTERFGSVEQAVASGLALRYDGGPCFRSQHYQTEIDHLGIARSPGLPLRAGDERLRREIHPNAQGTGALDRTLRHLRAAPAGSPGLRPPLQPRMAARAPRLSHTDRSPPTPTRPSGPAMITKQPTRVSGELGAAHYSPSAVSLAETPNPPSRTLLLTSMEERELVELDGLLAGAAAAGPTAQDGL